MTINKLCRNFESQKHKEKNLKLTEGKKIKQNCSCTKTRNQDGNRPEGNGALPLKW